MPSKPLRFIIPTNSLNQEVLISSYTASGTGNVADMVRDDKVLAYTIEPVIQNPEGSDPRYSPDYESTDTFQLAIGEADQPPESGTYDIAIGSQSLVVTYNITAAALETGLNVQLTAESEPLCTVTLLNPGVYQIDAVSDGAIASGFFDINSTALLLPQSDAMFNEQSLGSASSRYQVLLVVVQAPIAYSEPTVELAATDVDVATISAGSATTNKIQKVTFDVDDTYTGSFSISATTTGSDMSNCGVANPNMTAEEFGAVLAVHVNIEYQNPDGTADNIRPTKNNGAFFVEFIGTLKNSATPGITATDIDLVGPMGKSGTIDLNTIALYKKSRLTTAESFTEKISITRTRVTGERRTILLTDITLKKEIVDPVSMVPTPRADYYTVAQTDVLLAAKVSGPATATDNAVARYDGTTGKLIQNSGATVSDTGDITGVSISGVVFKADTGVVGTSGYSFTSDATTGWYLNGSNDLRLTVNGQFVMQISGTFFAPQKQFLLLAGSAAAPTISSYDTGQDGIYFTGSFGSLTTHISCNGVRKASFSASGTNLVLPTSSAGLSSGDLWNNSGIVTIV